MSDLIYFVEGPQTMPREKALELGLGYALSPSGGPEWAGAAEGPGGIGAGCYFAFGSGGIGHHGSCRWHKFPGREDLRIGFDPASPPGPEDLARAEQVSGHQVRLGDRREWLVPVARTISGGSAFPRRFVWDGKEWTPGRVMDLYSSLFEEACALWDAMLSAADGAGAVSVSRECDAAVRALAVNYRLGPAEVSAMELLDTSAEQRAILALVDFPSLDALKKKAESERQGSNAGDGV